MDTILVDTSHLMYRSWHTFKEFENASKQPTGMHFGILRAIEYLANTIPNSTIVFVLDGNCYKRKELYSQYKAGRGEGTHAEIVHEFGMKMDINELIRMSGCAIAHHSEYEADDIIAMIAKQPSTYLSGFKLGEKIIVYSGDDDFCQLVTDDVSIFKPPASKLIKARWMTPKTVKEEWGVDAPSLALYRSFTGDSGDNIPGCPRTPRARLQMAVEGKTEPTQFYDGDGLAYFTPDWKTKLTAFRPQCEVNFQLTRLPWEFVDSLPLEYNEYGLDMSNLPHLLARLEFTSFLKKIGALHELLGPIAYGKTVPAVSDRSQSGQNPSSGLEVSSSGPRLAD